MKFVLLFPVSLGMAIAGPLSSSDRDVNKLQDRQGIEMGTKCPADAESVSACTLSSRRGGCRWLLCSRWMANAKDSCRFALQTDVVVGF